MDFASLRALRHRNFRLYLAGQLFSLSGSWIHNTALSWLVYRLTHSEWMLGLVSLFNNLPMLLLGVWGGVVADCIPRRRIVLVTQSVFLVQAAFLAWLVASGQVRVWHVYVLGLLFGLANAFDIPARQAMLLDMSSEEDLISAVSLNSLTFNLARIAGPALGGFTIGLWGEAWCFALNALSFGAVLLGLLRMRLPVAPRMQRPAREAIRELIGFLRESPLEARLLLLCALLNVGFSGVFVLNPFFAEDLFHRGPAGLGALTAAMGIGAVVGTYLLAAQRNPAALPRVSILSGLLLGAALLVFAASPRFELSLLAMALAGGALMRQNAATNSTLQRSVPPRLRGRVVALFGTTVVGMAPIGAALFAALARVSGVRLAAAGAGLLCALTAALLSRRLRSATTLATLLLTFQPGWAASQDLLKQVDFYLKAVSRITGFPVSRPVPAALMSRAELDRYLAGKMRSEVDTSKIESEETVLKMFGFAPPDFRLKQTTLDLLGEQAAAFYDFKAKKLFVLDHVQDGLGPELLVHELGHALADQRFGLARFLKRAPDDDGALARMAVMEGQAMWLMGEHAAGLAGTSLRQSPELVKRLIEADAAGDDSHPVLNSVPLYMRESLLFPYAQGVRFQAAVCARHEDCLSRVFQSPPVSSAQVLHPELYFAGVQPETVSPPERRRGYRRRVSGSLGEIDLSILVRTFRLEADDLIEAFRGGAYRLDENRKSRDPLLAHASVWNNEAAAQRWMAIYCQVMEAKWKRFAIENRGPDRIEGSGDRGGFVLRRQGRSVLVEEGLPLH
ncbi:MAG: MFS transporter [Acidobacteriota bacterium]